MNCFQSQIISSTVSVLNVAIVLQDSVGKQAVKGLTNNTVKIRWQKNRSELSQHFCCGSRFSYHKGVCVSLCMFVYRCLCVCVFLCACLCIGVCVCVFLCACLCIGVCVCVSLCMFVYRCVNVCVHACTCRLANVFLCVFSIQSNIYIKKVLNQKQLLIFVTVTEIIQSWSVTFTW